MLESLTIERHKHGIVIRGALPLSMFKQINRDRKPEWDRCDMLIAKHLRATLVITGGADLEQWRAELGLADREV
jgi:hypothetical protein